MQNVYVESSNAISSLGFTTEENYKHIISGKSGVKINNNSNLSKNEFPASSIENMEIDSRFKKISNGKEYTRFEKLAILSIQDAIQNTKLDLTKKRTLFILSTTKGNIELLDKKLKGNFDNSRLQLHTTAKTIADFFDFENTPIVVSNACISGVAAIVLAQRLIRQAKYDNVIVNGTDTLSRFVVSGFQSFHSLSSEICKPFDANRVGLNLGEGSATLIITKEKTTIEIKNGATSNDANHISGPSREGDGLLVSINKTIQDNKNIDFISAHGTATPYNDDMESQAIFRAGLNQVPTNSMKAYFGHTLGAAGVIESVISIEAMKNNLLINTIGCEKVGVVQNIKVCRKTEKKEINTVLKLASGFGGGNAAVLFTKSDLD